MKKLAFLVATAALSLWGCASSSRSLARADEEPIWNLTNEKLTAEKSRMGAPTVYNGEATGGAGFAVITGDGQVWAPEEAPGNTVLRTQSDVQASIRRHSKGSMDGQSQVIDEGRTGSQLSQK